MVADNKKCLSLINIVAEEVVKLQAISTRLQALRTAFQSHNPDTTGTPLEGHETTISNWVTDVVNVANSAVPNGFIANVVPSHRGKAMGDL
jgi:hypothetical protein